jgi:hypothetical protein
LDYLITRYAKAETADGEAWIERKSCPHCGLRLIQFERAGEFGKIKAMVETGNVPCLWALPLVIGHPSSPTCAVRTKIWLFSRISAGVS